MVSLKPQTKIFWYLEKYQMLPLSLPTSFPLKTRVDPLADKFGETNYKSLHMANISKILRNLGTTFHPH